MKKTNRRLDVDSADDDDGDVSRAEISILERLIQLSELSALVRQNKSKLLSEVAQTFPNLPSLLERKHAAETQALASRLRKSVLLGTDGIDVPLTSTKRMDAARKRQLMETLDSPEKIADVDILRTIVDAWPTSY